jgi:hypothetical protein
MSRAQNRPDDPDTADPDTAGTAGTAGTSGTGGEAVPPYEGRRKSADVGDGGTGPARRRGVRRGEDHS